MLFLVVTLPILLSLNPQIYYTNYYAKYTSPEGIDFLSYSKNWGDEDLLNLYQELLKNKHGEELNLLQEVRVISGSSQSNKSIKGQYSPLTNTITLYDGDKYTSVAQVKETLSHEYGHHFAYYYFPSHHFPFSKWAKLRGLEDQPVHWNSFFNYSIDSHEWIPQEIFADDYVLLYGSTHVTEKNDVYTNEAFYTRTEHENQQLENIFDNQELIQYIENKSGIEVDNDRLIQTPTLQDITDNRVTISISNKPNVAYRLNLKIYEKVNDELIEVDSEEMVQITSASTGNTLQFPIDFTNTSRIIDTSFDIVDMETSIGFKTESRSQ